MVVNKYMYICITIVSFTSGSCALSFLTRGLDCRSNNTREYLFVDPLSPYFVQFPSCLTEDVNVILHCALQAIKQGHHLRFIL